MNGNEQFIPKWADKALGGNVGPNEPSLELTMLRQFFDNWQALHAIKGDKRNPDIRKQYENAAQALVDASHAIAALRNG